MKKFDFSKEFGNIDSKYIEEAEGEWKGKKETWTPNLWSKVAAACVIVALGSVIFSNPQVQAAIKSLTLSIGETLGFSNGIESYTEVLNTSKTDNGIKVTLKEVVLDDGVLLAKVHAEKEDPSSEIYFTSTGISIEYQKSTINGQKIDEYGSGSYLPYSDEDLGDGVSEDTYDAVLESRFQNSADLGENPEVHLVLGAYTEETFDADPSATFEFDFSIPHADLMKQTVHKELDDISIETDEGTVKLTDISMNKLQSTILAEVPVELRQNYELSLQGTDSKGNQIQYELNGSPEDDSQPCTFKTNFWGRYQMDSEEPVLLIPDIDSEYLELQLCIREPYVSPDGDVISWEEDTPMDEDWDTEDAENTVIGDADGFTEINVQDDENAVIGGADSPTEINLQDGEQIVYEDDDFYITEDDEVWGGPSGNDTYCGWIAVGDKIKIQLK